MKKKQNLLQFLGKELNDEDLTTNAESSKIEDDFIIKTAPQGTKMSLTRISTINKLNEILDFCKLDNEEDDIK